MSEEGKLYKEKPVQIGDTVKITNKRNRGYGKIGVVEVLGVTIGVWVRVGKDDGLYFVPFDYEKVEAND